MYDAKKRLRLSSITTVEELIKVLETYNPKAKVMVDGCNYFYIHSKKVEGQSVLIIHL